MRDTLATDIEQVYSADKSFAARTRDGSRVAWGHQQYGGNSAAVADQLAAGVVRVYSTCYGHAALKDEGSLASWGLLASDPFIQLQRVQRPHDILGMS